MSHSFPSLREGNSLISDNSPGSGSTPPSSQPASAARKSLRSGDSLDHAVKHNSVFTKYLGGKIISTYSVITVVSSLTLLGLAIASFVVYTPMVSDMRNKYILEVSSAGYAATVNAFLSTILSAKLLLDNTVDPGTVIPQFPAILSLTVAGNLSSTFISYSAGIPDVVVTSNADDCGDSVVYTCSTEYVDSDIRDSQWYLTASSIDVTTVDYVWSGPDVIVNATDNSTLTTIDLLWKVVDNETSFTVFQVTVNASYLELSKDPFLDRTGGLNRVWLVNRDNGYIVTAYGIDPSLFSVGPDQVSVFGNLTSFPHTAWLAAIPALSVSAGYTTLVPHLPGGVSAAISGFDNSPFSLIIGSTTEQFSDSLFSSLFIAEMAVSILPIAGTILISIGFTLRLIAVRRRRIRRQEDLQDAQLALQAIKASKLKAAASTVGTSNWKATLGGQLSGLGGLSSGLDKSKKFTSGK